MEVLIKYFSDRIDPVERISMGDWIDLRSAEDISLRLGSLPISRWEWG